MKFRITYEVPKEINCESTIYKKPLVTCSFHCLMTKLPTILSAGSVNHLVTTFPLSTFLACLTIRLWSWRISWLMYRSMFILRSFFFLPLLCTRVLLWYSLCPFIKIKDQTQARLLSGDRRAVSSNLVSWISRLFNLYQKQYDTRILHLVLIDYFCF